MSEINYRDKMFVCWRCEKKRKCKEHECTIQWCWEFEQKISRESVLASEKPLHSNKFQAVKSGSQGIVLDEKTGV